MSWFFDHIIAFFELLLSRGFLQNKALYFFFQKTTTSAFFKNKQAHIVDQKKEQQKNKTEDALKDLFEAKLKAFEIEEVKNSENKFLRSKIRKSQNMIELNAWVTAILLESIPQEDE